MKRIPDACLQAFAWICCIAVVSVVLVLSAFLLKRGLKYIDLGLFFGDTPWIEAVTGSRPVFDGIWPTVAGTFWLVSLSAAMSIPAGTASGIYLSEYASGRVRSFLNLTVDLLSGTPSIVMGLFGFTMILFLRKTLLPEARTCLFLSAACIALLILPYVIRTTQTSLDAIPGHIRLLGPAMGFTQWQNIRRVLLPLSARGILSGAILAIGRAAEDTAVILLTGVVAHAGLPASLWDRYEALPFRIYFIAAEHRTPEEMEQGLGIAVVLLLMTGALFATAAIIHKSIEKQWTRH